MKKFGGRRRSASRSTSHDTPTGSAAIVRYAMPPFSHSPPRTAMSSATASADPANASAGPVTSVKAVIPSRWNVYPSPTVARRLHSATRQKIPPYQTWACSLSPNRRHAAVRTAHTTSGTASTQPAIAQAAESGTAVASIASL